MPDWPHAPTHWFRPNGIYMVTASTYRKAKLFDSPKKLSMLQESLIESAEQAGWALHAWAVFSNHYHFVGYAAEEAHAPSRWIKAFHMRTAKALNAMDSALGRRVWYQYWDTELTYQRSYFARLAYVHFNAVRHGIVKEPTLYKWSSAAWFQQSASSALYKTITSIKTDQVKVIDTF